MGYRVTFKDGRTEYVDADELEVGTMAVFTTCEERPSKRRGAEKGETVTKTHTIKAIAVHTIADITEA